ncbi:magnesium transporter CorA family protein [Eggerthellaceae bacterium zg-1084]|uniref:Magnesium transporter CorA family protein n=1 Tax=Berryella wangjianweii TaxID=2734634 RepID=A0A6M8J2F5_9ACTN|nr:magnesium transporter CorA family protein [Berryella wangjianweii]NPD31323.1 magnesium transporter CorA family protein [Berryella wangjianweii]NPD32368.1 magnesium transporter CorA family protein [Eggerthellaceae bacterium zg-997]QKF06863.1 magnesium transporter CorA family protein [Berryella wangjianweii]
MIECFKTGPEGTVQVPSPVPGCWISVVSPDQHERAWLEDEIGVVPEFVRSAFDPEESSHTDFDDDTRQALVIVDCPVIEDDQESDDPSAVQYETQPLTLLFVPERDMLITVSLRRNETIEMFSSGRMRNVNTNQRARLLLQMLLHISQRYLQCLRNIDRQFNRNEKILRETLRDEELIKMLGFQKSLVYFSTSLKADEATLMRIKSRHIIRLYEEDEDLLDDVFIEIRQAIEMANIYTNILEGTMDTFGTIITNNVNQVMRTLTVVMLVFSVPTIVFSFYGMNVDDLPLSFTWLEPIGLTVCLMLLALGVLRRKRII